MQGPRALTEWSLQPTALDLHQLRWKQIWNLRNPLEPLRMKK